MRMRTPLSINIAGKHEKPRKAKDLKSLRSRRRTEEGIFLERLKRKSTEESHDAETRRVLGAVVDEHGDDEKDDIDDDESWCEPREPMRKGLPYCSGIPVRWTNWVLVFSGMDLDLYVRRGRLLPHNDQEKNHKRGRIQTAPKGKMRTWGMLIERGRGEKEEIWR